MGETKKDYCISFIRLLSMFMIITCHLFQYYGSAFFYLFNVGVPLFLIISGYLYGAKRIDSAGGFILRQFRKILVPYWAFILVASACYWAFSPEYINSAIFLKAFFTVGTINGIGHLWFVKYILFCYCLLPLLNAVRERVRSGIAMVAVAAASMLFVSFFFTEYPFLDGVFVNCFVLGYFMRNVECGLNGKIVVLLYACIIMVAVAVNAERVVLIAGNMPAYHWNGEFNKYAHLLLGAALFILLHRLVVIAKGNRVLDFSDRYSYCIYLVHQLFILSPFAVMALTQITALNILLAYALSCLGGYLLCRAASHLA